MSAVAATPTARTRRIRARTGLTSTIVAVIASVLAYALQGLGLDGQTPANLVTYGVVFAVLALGGWYAVRRLARDADPILYPTAVLLGGLGLAMLYRLMTAREHPEFATEQAVWLAIGLGVLVATLALVRDVRQLDAYTYTIGLLGIVLLLLPIVPKIGTEINGARLWVNLGFITFQPAEAGRILIVIFLASYLGQRRELLATGVGRFGLPRVKDLGPIMLAWGASLLVLFLERDMGASLLLFGVFIVMLWVATGRWAYLVLGLILFAIGAYIGYLAFSHVQVRVDAWLHAMDPGKVNDEGYQLSQGWFALASGGMVGTGLGLGSPTLIPYVGSDFILAAFGEELGMLGVSAMLLLYLVVVGRGLRIAVERHDSFEKLLAVGITTVLGLQVFVIAGGVLRLIPLTGVPLPLVSYGGTSRVASAVAIALLLRTSAGPWIRRRREPAKQPADAEAVTA
ncbi:MAG TPA: FtsW/RodA/SpoVE family cell cycle protein [Actinomycetota bacterium]|nr:FtsW/RodA/SpoVE family cell cycle protein [Actinomycetota bacterium]